MLCIKHLGILSLLVKTRLDWVIQAMVHLYVLRCFMTLFAKIIILSSRASEAPLVKLPLRKPSYGELIIIFPIIINMTMAVQVQIWKYQSRMLLHVRGKNCMSPVVWLHIVHNLGMHIICIHTPGPFTPQIWCSVCNLLNAQGSRLSL